MQRPFFIFAFLLLPFYFAASPAEAQQQIVAVDIHKAELFWTWRTAAPPNDGIPTQWALDCGLASGKYTVSASVPFAASPTDLYTTPVEPILGKPGNWFCVVAAVNPIGRSGASNEISFFAGAVPGPATGLGVRAQ